MAELKFGGNDVSKLMYGDTEISGNQMLESGTILYIGPGGEDIKLPNVSPNWSNVKGLHFNIIFGVSKQGLGLLADTIDITNFDLSTSWNVVNTTIIISKKLVDDVYYLSVQNPSNYGMRITAL